MGHVRIELAITFGEAREGPRDVVPSPSWREMLRSLAELVRHLRTVFDALPWWRLQPDRKAVIEPSDPSPAALPLVATTTGQGPRTTVAYLPAGGRLVLRSESVQPVAATRHDPATGATGATAPLDLTLDRTSADGTVLAIAETPTGQDWLVVIRA